MEVRFECIVEGKRLFQVVHIDGETSLFTGTPAQCKRFIEVYKEKLQRTRTRDTSHHGMSGAKQAAG